MTRYYRTRWTADDECKDCGFERRFHQSEVARSEKGTEYLLYHCPDPSLPDTENDDDPWAEPVAAYNSGISELFDDYE